MSQRGMPVSARIASMLASMLAPATTRKKSEREGLGECGMPASARMASMFASMLAVVERKRERMWKSVGRWSAHV
eukprot:126166-Chlamydomonas_euryale.AAC.1